MAHPGHHPRGDERDPRPGGPGRYTIVAKVGTRCRQPTGGHRGDRLATRARRWGWVEASSTTNVRIGREMPSCSAAGSTASPTATPGGRRRSSIGVQAAREASRAATPSASSRTGTTTVSSPSRPPSSSGDSATGVATSIPRRSSRTSNARSATLATGAPPGEAARPRARSRTAAPASARRMIVIGEPPMTTRPHSTRRTPGASAHWGALRSAICGHHNGTGGTGDADDAHVAVMPPSTGTRAPVMPDAPAEHSQATASATSSGRSRRSIGC